MRSSLQWPWQAPLDASSSWLLVGLCARHGLVAPPPHVAPAPAMAIGLTGLAFARQQPTKQVAQMARDVLLEGSTPAAPVAFSIAMSLWALDHLRAAWRRQVMPVALRTLETSWPCAVA